MKTFYAAAFTLFSIILLSGCGPSAPEGLAPIRPFSVKVVNGTTPIEGVKVTLHAPTATGNAVFTGDTDASGVASIKTMAGSFIGNGAPEGSYKVTLIKYANLPTTLSDQDRETMSSAEIKKYDDEYNKKVTELEKIIPLIYRTVDKTPLETTVPDQGVFEVDITKYAN